MVCLLCGQICGQEHLCRLCQLKGALLIQEKEGLKGESEESETFDNVRKRTDPYLRGLLQEEEKNVSKIKSRMSRQPTRIGKRKQKLTRGRKMVRTRSNPSIGSEIREALKNNEPMENPEAAKRKWVSSAPSRKSALTRNTMTVAKFGSPRITRNCDDSTNPDTLNDLIDMLKSPVSVSQSASATRHSRRNSDPMRLSAFLGDETESEDYATDMISYNITLEDFEILQDNESSNPSEIWIGTESSKNPKQTPHRKLKEAVEHMARVSSDNKRLQHELKSVSFQLEEMKKMKSKLVPVSNAQIDDDSSSEEEVINIRSSSAGSKIEEAKIEADEAEERALERSVSQIEEGFGSIRITADGNKAPRAKDVFGTAADVEEDSDDDSLELLSQALSESQLKSERIAQLQQELATIKNGGDQDRDTQVSDRLNVAVSKLRERLAASQAEAQGKSERIAALEAALKGQDTVRLDVEESTVEITDDDSTISQSGHNDSLLESLQVVEDFNIQDSDPAEVEEKLETSMSVRELEVALRVKETLSQSRTEELEGKVSQLSDLNTELQEELRKLKEVQSRSAPPVSANPRRGVAPKRPMPSFPGAASNSRSKSGNIVRLRKQPSDAAARFRSPTVLQQHHSVNPLRASARPSPAAPRQSHSRRKSQGDIGDLTLQFEYQAKPVSPRSPRDKRRSGNIPASPRGKSGSPPVSPRRGVPASGVAAAPRRRPAPRPPGLPSVPRASSPPAQMRSVADYGVAHEQNPAHRPTMEDEHVQVDGMLGDRSAFFAVYDGHGGTGAVLYTARHLHENLRQRLQQVDQVDPLSVSRAFLESFQQTDAEMPEEEVGASGCTVAAALIHEGHLYTAGCGDARVVLVGPNGFALRMTTDHKATDPEEKKRIQEAGGFVVMNRVCGVLAVSRALGDLKLKPYVSGVPYCNHVELGEEHTYVVVACDGIFDVIEDDVLSEIINSNQTLSAQLMSELLVQLAMKRGSTDNISIQIIKL